MKVGDLVMDIDPHYTPGQLGIIVKASPGGGWYEVLLNDGPEWLSATYLEIVN